ncbi:Protein of unknown function [Lactobacillus delbrueckii subsp. lactis]|nr:Putative uncharacterized protein [Lactobacillus delbrueckii subsp. lactis]CDR82877.1 Protein of unknown function [Lactobacillus delbrueckii subsp. lactis]CDR84286.1 Protein of unknown function [Lactobacillus delbrueckii subsp. lactis]
MIKVDGLIVDLS